MKKEKIIKEIKNMIQVIDDNEELFHDGIDEEISYLLFKTLDYLEKNDKKQERIDKAIEYIKNNSYIASIEEIPLFTMNSNPQDLLNILKGDNK